MCCVAASYSYMYLYVPGLDALKRIGEQYGSKTGVPSATVLIADCGLLADAPPQPERKEKNEAEKTPGESEQPEGSEEKEDEGVRASLSAGGLKVLVDAMDAVDLPVSLIALTPH